MFIRPFQPTLPTISEQDSEHWNSDSDEEEEEEEEEEENIYLFRK